MNPRLFWGLGNIAEMGERTFGWAVIYVRFIPERCYEAEGCGLKLLR